MERVRNLLLAVGTVIIAVGLAWLAHGTGIIQLPATGFMSELSVWTINGALAITFGLIVLLGSWMLLRDVPHSPDIGDDHLLGEP